jgi:hypothetical protein
MKKRGAIDLSLSTIIIIILAVIMLILGVVLVKKAMCGAIKGIDVINDQTKQQIVDLFGEKKDIAVKETSNEIYKGVEYGVGFAIRNNGNSDDQFSYSVKVGDIGRCKFSESKAESFILLGRAETLTIASGDEYVGLIKFLIPSDVENCDLRYKIVVKNGDNEYSKDFDVKILNKPFSKSLC